MEIEKQAVFTAQNILITFFLSLVVGIYELTLNHRNRSQCCIICFPNSDELGTSRCHSMDKHTDTSIHTSRFNNLMKLIKQIHKPFFRIKSS